MALRFYVLDESGEPKLSTQLEWVEWFNQNDPHVADTFIRGVRVSTIFTGHAWEDHQPVVWQTIVEGGRLDQTKGVCAGKRDQAEAMHNEMVERVKKTFEKEP